MARVKVYRRQSLRNRLSRNSNAKLYNQAFFDHTPSPAFFPSTTAASITRKCDTCENKEDKLQRTAKSPSVRTGASVSSFIHSLGSKGSSLSPNTRSFFEPKFKTSFEDVKVHTDVQSTEAASSVHAKAFTFKNHIVFNKDQYKPESTDGKKLIAHELTHVVQQNNGIKRMEVERPEEEKIQRAAHDDFAIRGIYPGAASVPDTIYFDFSSASIVSSEKLKVPALASPAASSLTLTGTMSEEGDPAFNTSLMNSRISKVSSELRKHGHTGPRIPNPQPTAGVGNIDYRRNRAVEVIPTPVVVPPSGIPPSHTPPCAAGPVVSCGTSFMSAFPVVLARMIAAISQLSAGTPMAHTEVSSLFPGKTIADVAPHISNLYRQILLLPSHHICHNSCDSMCSRPAYNTGSGAAASMVLCDGYQSASPDFRVYLLIHEALHATPGLTTVDIAYSFTRLIQSLSGADAMRNTDSYVLLILRLGGAATGSFTPPADTYAGLSPAEQPLVRDAMSFLEQWLDKSEFDSSILYEGVEQNIGRAGGWAPAQHWHAGKIHSISMSLGLTDPGTAPFPNAPVEQDKWILAGVYDRFKRMKSAVYGIPLSFGKAPAGLGAWAVGLGPSAQVGNPFFAPALTPPDRVKYLMRLMIKSIPGEIPSSRINAYIDVADVLRRGRSVGP